jgi:hypothetical protein
MPGAPNRPPDTSPAPAPAPPVPEDPKLRVVRRLAPARVALSLDVWKGAPNSDILSPLEKAEALYLSGDFANADGELDKLSVRFAEPRWPSLPVPFKELRVAIPAPMPPNWNPEFSLPPEEKEARKRHRFAELQLALAAACVDWMGLKGLPVDDLSPHIPAARAALPPSGVPPEFWAELDPVWNAVRERVPMPKGPPGRAAPPPAPEAA